MQLYKSRDFGGFFSDTFTFLKATGGHFFKNFVVINGVFLIILTIIGYFFSKFYIGMLSSVAGGNPDEVSSYFFENLGSVGLFVILFLVLGVISSIVFYAFTPIYMQLYEKNGNSFSANDIIMVYKKNAFKLLKFVVMAFLLAIPLTFIMAIIMFALVITIIGIFALPFAVAIFVLLYYFALSEYLNTDKRAFACFEYAWKLLRSKFWHAIGATGLFFFILYIVQYVVTLVFGMAGSMQYLISNEGSDVLNTEGLTITVVITMLITYAISFLLQAVVQINQGITYYGLKEDVENIGTSSIIDEIGME